MAPKAVQKQCKTIKRIALSQRPQVGDNSIPMASMPRQEGTRQFQIMVDGTEP
jgi:hypothetical protein